MLTPEQKESLASIERMEKFYESELNQVKTKLHNLRTERMDIVRIEAQLDNPWMPGVWDCNDSPFKTCVYDLDSDWQDDCCIYCGDPYERK